MADITVPETTGNTVGTGGGGLLAALDVMAFTNDLEFSSENQTSTSFKTQPQPSEVSCVESDSNSDPLYNDPLRQLVIHKKELSLYIIRMFYTTLKKKKFLSGYAV